MNAADVLDKVADTLHAHNGRVLAALMDAEPNAIIGNEAYEAFSSHIGKDSVAAWAFGRPRDEVITALRECAAAERAKP